MSVPLLETTDPAAAFAAVAAEDRGVDLTGAVLVTEGWENLVVETRDGWILRFPRREEPDFDREVAVLSALAGRVPVPIPTVAWTGRRTRVMAYRTLRGHWFDASAYVAASARERDALTASLAEALLAIHESLEFPAVRAVGVPHVDLGLPVTAVVDRLAEIPAEHVAAVERLLVAYSAVWVEGSRREADVLMHNDFHLRNMVLDGPCGRLVGLWDFSCVQVGPPSVDLRYLARTPRGPGDAATVRADLLPRLARHYERLGGAPVDVEAADLALRMEWVSDALDIDPTVLAEALAERP